MPGFLVGFKFGFTCGFKFAFNGPSRAAIARIGPDLYRTIDPTNCADYGAFCLTGDKPMKPQDLIDLAMSAYDLRVEAMESDSDFDSLLAEKLAQRLEREMYRRSQSVCTETETRELLKRARPVIN